MQDNPSAAAPCRVRKIFIRGLQHTRESVVRNELARLDQASTLGEIGDGCLEAAAGLQSLNIFEGCDVLVDSAPRSSGETPLADIIVTVNEKKRLTSAATGVSTQGGEGSMDANVTVRNALGYAERLDLNMELGQQKSSTFKLSATRPRFQGTDAELTADVSKCVHSAPDHARPFPPRPSLLLLAGTHTHPGAPLCPLSSHSTSAPPRLPSAFPPPSLRLPSAFPPAASALASAHCASGAPSPTSSTRPSWRSCWVAASRRASARRTGPLACTRSAIRSRAGTFASCPRGLPPGPSYSSGVSPSSRA